MHATPALHKSPNCSRPIFGYRLEAGDVLEPTDVYDSTGGDWQPCPVPGAKLTSGTGVALWVRPAAASANQEPKRRLKLDPNLADGQHWTIHDKPDSVLLELIQLWMDEAVVGESIEITLVEMTDAEADALPDI